MYSRKFIALVLAFAMLAVPVLSLGEAAPKSFLDQAFEAGRSVKTTVTFTPGDMLTQDPSLAAAADLLKVLKVEASKQEKDGTALEKIELFLQDKSSLDFSFLTEPGQFHLLSSLLGGQVLSFTPEEFVTLYMNLLQSASGEAFGLGAEELEAMRASITASLSSMESSKEAPKDLASVAAYMELDPESLQKDLVDPIIAWYADITSKPEVTQGTFESEKHDAAVTQKVYTISVEQIKAALEIVSSWATRDQNLDWIIKKSASSGTETLPSKEELRAQLAALPEEFAKEAASASEPITITITELLDAQGAVKAFEVKAGSADEASPDAITGILAGKYVKTEADGVATLYSLAFGGDGDEAAFSFTNKEFPASAEGASKTSWQLAGSVKEAGTETVSFALAFDSSNAKTADSTQDDWKLDVTVNTAGMPLSASLVGTEKSVLSGVDAKADGKVDINVLGAPALTINYTTASGDPAALPAIPDDSVRLGKMTQEELDAWGQEASTTAMSQLMGLMSNLPPSILALFGSNQ